ncbi:MAG: hypothetical protein K6G91_08890 [Kiritimatiellae bacterium]|nr:hypothetical protein [Kiritimatiellia bacterium]
MPVGGVLTKSAGTKVLSAVAVGAVRYKWTMNGVPISDGENGNLSVSWVKGGSTDGYTVTPVYTVFGSEVDGAAVSVSVYNAPPGTMIILR